MFYLLVDMTSVLLIFLIVLCLIRKFLFPYSIFILHWFTVMMSKTNVATTVMCKYLSRTFNHKQHMMSTLSIVLKRRRRRRTQQCSNSGHGYECQKWTARKYILFLSSITGILLKWCWIQWPMAASIITQCTRMTDSVQWSPSGGPRCIERFTRSYLDSRDFHASIKIKQ